MGAMDDVGTRASTDRGGPRAGAPSGPVPAARRTSVHVHATPAAAVAEMDAQLRQWMEWLARSRRRAEVAGAGERPTGGIPG